MATRRPREKRSTPSTHGRKRKGPTKAELKARALKAAETRRRNAREAERKKERARQARRERERVKAEAHRKRVEAGRRGALKRRARERAAAALGEFRRAVDKNTRERELERVRESWHRSKRDLLQAVDEDYERYLAILDELADDEGIEWDIAYGETESAA